MDEDEVIKVLGRLLPKSSYPTPLDMLDMLTKEASPQLQRSRTSTSRSDPLDKAIKAARAAIKARLKREPKAAEVIQYLESEATGSGPLVDYQDDAIIWEDAKGKLHNTSHKTIENRLTAIRKRS